MPLLEDDHTINETYVIERFLGEGAFAEVYRVNHRFLGRQAMKVFKSASLDKGDVERKLQEATLLSKIGHPNIVRIFDANIIRLENSDRGYFTMEYVAGGSLDTFWKSYGDQFVPIDTTIEILKQMCRGMSVAHKEQPPIIHRDIKPHNILVGYDGSGVRIKICDFGLAKEVNPLTLLATAKGTRGFKAPEVFSGKGMDSLAGDVWAIGCVMYLLLTDRLPFPEVKETFVIDVPDFSKDLQPPSDFNPSVDKYLDKITQKALSIDPKNRYQDATQLYEAVLKWKPVASLPSKNNLSDWSKSALGNDFVFNEKEALEELKRAKEMSKSIDKLGSAADLLEGAFNKWPGLRDRYEYHLQLWRRGVMM